MLEKKTFCEECRNDVIYLVEEIDMQNTLKGESFEYAGKKAVCPNCGLEVYVPEIEDYNLKKLYDAYRKKYSIISLEKILEIMGKYGIGKRPLSLLLGWGEMTFSRYCDGDMPTKQYSNILARIYDNPEYYRSILEENKDNLKSQSAFEKSKRIVDDILGTINSPRTKMDLVIDYLLYKCEDITPLALQKALYYIQGFHYAFMDDFLFEADCEAWAHGPVYRDIYQRYSSYRFDPIEDAETINTSTFTSNERSIIDSVVRNLCCYSGKILESFTHSEIPWLKTRGDLPVSAASNRMIHKKIIGDYFKAVKEHNEMINPSDIEIYSKKMFKQTI